MAETVNLAVLRHRKDDQLAYAVFTQGKDIAGFLKEHSGMGDYCPEDEEVEENWKDSVWSPVCVTTVELHGSVNGDISGVYKTLMDLNGLFEKGEIEDLFTLLFFSGFEAGVKFQQEQQIKDHKKAIEIDRWVGETM